MMSEMSVQVQRLVDEKDAQSAYCCMSGSATPWEPALCVCRDWIAENLGKHIEGYHLALENDKIIGHLYFAPSIQALIPYSIEPDAAVIYCEWIQREHQGKGLGKQLFDTFLGEMKANNSKGIVVVTSDEEGEPQSQTYIKRGFEVIHREGSEQLLFLPLAQTSIEFQPLKQQLKPKRISPVEIHIINGYMCPHEVATQLVLQEVVKEFGDQVILKEVILTPETLSEYGAASGIFINGKRKLGGGEIEEAVRQAIAEELG
jgi:ribosomal protein S18 acetylase RimI-like enzyme